MIKELDENLSWLASFICDMYLDNKDAKRVYDQLVDDKEKDFSKKLENFYDNNFENFMYSKNYFVKSLNNIYKTICENAKKNINDSYVEDFNLIVSRDENYIFEKLAYPLYLFTKNLYYNLLRDGAKTVFFLSREGQFMKKMFDFFQDSIVGPKIKTEYLCVSRASTFLGTLKDLNEEDFDSLFNQYPNLSLENFCKNLAFSKEEIEVLANKSEYNFKIDILNIKDSRKFREVINSPYFIKLYDKKRKEAHDLFTSYVASFGDDYKDKLYIVDVGWKGTIQNNIQKMFPNTIINGYYLGLMNYAPIKDYNSKFPILFEHTLIYRSPNCYLYNSNRSIFEIILAANHGSTKKYEKNAKGKIEPVFQNEEMEMKMYQEKIKPVQDNIFKVFTELVSVLNTPFYDRKAVEKTINRKYFELIFNPSKKEVLEYKSFYHFENFGVMNYSKFNEREQHSIMKKIKNYLHFRKFIQYDDTWQYLKLYNNDMKLGIKFVYWYKLRTFKKMDIM